LRNRLRLPVPPGLHWRQADDRRGLCTIPSQHFRHSLVGLGWFPGIPCPRGLSRRPTTAPRSGRGL